MRNYATATAKAPKIFYAYSELTLPIRRVCRKQLKQTFARAVFNATSTSYIHL